MSIMPKAKPQRSKKLEMHTQVEGKTRPGGQKPSQWQRGRVNSGSRLDMESNASKPSSSMGTRPGAARGKSSRKASSRKAR